jgi:hypothetical protein
MSDHYIWCSMPIAYIDNMLCGQVNASKAIASIAQRGLRVDATGSEFGCYVNLGLDHGPGFQSPGGGGGG